MFHLVADDSVKSTSISTRNPVIVGLRHALHTAVRHNITTITIPLLLFHEMKEVSLLSIWWRNLEDWEEQFKHRIPQSRANWGVVSKVPAAFPSSKLNRSFRVYHISCYWMNIQVDSTSSNLASAMLNSKIRPRAVVGYGVKIFYPSPPNYVTRSPGEWYSWFSHDVTVAMLVPLN